MIITDILLYQIKNSETSLLSYVSMYISKRRFINSLQSLTETFITSFLDLNNTLSSSLGLKLADIVDADYLCFTYLF